MTSLKLDGVSKSLGGVEVLHGISLSVRSGTRAAIVGSSGSGKSTLLRLIAGFERTDAGTIVLDGQPVCGPADFVPAHRRGVGYVAQDGALFPHLTVESNIGFGLRDRTAKKQRVLEVCELVNLETRFLRRFPHELSGGQQQRVALARALAPAPGVILLDEPFSALDTGLRAHTRQSVIDALDRAEVTTILVTHDQDEAMRFGHEIGVLEDGRLIQYGPPDDVFGDPSTPLTAQFLGAAIFVPVRRRQGQAVSALGVLPVRHDHGDRDGAACALIRPEQLSVAASGAGSPARVESVRSHGSHIEIDLTIDGDPEPIALTLRLPRYRSPEFLPGSTMRVCVGGSVVLYDA
ncbi:ABC transporter ATP-binding protein [Parafrigoribacterium mesophilum]|uniref:ABC transporter ATP-binding protein n=1 Tax=Parafrigoribacterium mesophilum TaxID=433646 RepID=UPI0031FE10E9